VKTRWITWLVLLALAFAPLARALAAELRHGDGLPAAVLCSGAQVPVQFDAATFAAETDHDSCCVCCPAAGGEAPTGAAPSIAAVAIAAEVAREPEAACAQRAIEGGQARAPPAVLR
jgi:hypothetical protein